MPVWYSPNKYIPTPRSSLHHPQLCAASCTRGGPSDLVTLKQNFKKSPPPLQPCMAKYVSPVRQYGFTATLKTSSSLHPYAARRVSPVKRFRSTVVIKQSKLQPQVYGFKMVWIILSKGRIILHTGIQYQFHYFPICSKYLWSQQNSFNITIFNK